MHHKRTDLLPISYNYCKEIDITECNTYTYSTFHFVEKCELAQWPTLLSNCIQYYIIAYFSFSITGIFLQLNSKIYSLHKIEKNVERQTGSIQMSIKQVYQFLLYKIIFGKVTKTIWYNCCWNQTQWRVKIECEEH